MLAWDRDLADETLARVVRDSDETPARFAGDSDETLARVGGVRRMASCQLVQYTRAV